MTKRDMVFPILLALVFVALLLPSPQLGSNEEHYLQRAYHYVEPDAFGPQSAIFGSGVSRVASDVVIGYPVAWFGYRGADGVLRVANALLYAAGFALLASAWGLTTLEALMTLAAFCLLGQQLFGGEWLFQDIEGKTFAYALVLAGLGWVVRRRSVPADLCFIAATWLHLLVGGFWLLFALLFRLLRGDRPAAVGAQLLRYGAGVVPLAILLLLEQTRTQAAGAAYSTAYIYSMVRNAHHVAPFSDVHILWSWTPGIVSAGGLLLALIVAARNCSGALRAFLFSLAAVVVFLFLALGATWLDRHTGALGELFLFRPSSLSLLLALVAFAAWLRHVWGASLQRLQWLVALWLLPVFAWSAVKAKAEQWLGGAESRAELAALVDLVDAHTAPEDLVLMQPGRDGEPPEVSLPRLLHRPTFVSWKFVPTSPGDLMQWYERMQRRATLFDSACHDRAGLEPRLLIGWASGWQPQLLDCGDVLWRSAHYWVIEVR